MRHAPDNALVLFPGALGDFLCFLPTLLALCERHRGGVTLIANPAVLEMVRREDLATTSIHRREVADLFASETPLAAATKELLRHFTFAYSWTGFGDANLSARLAAATGGTVKVYPFRAMAPSEHAIDYYARCAGVVHKKVAVSDLNEDASWLAGFESRHGIANRRLLAVHPGSGSPKKNWQGMGEVIDDWSTREGDAIIGLHGPAEDGILIPSGAFIARGLSLPQVATLLRRSSLYLGNDSGISHLAGALKVPGVVVFGPTDPRVWAPRSAALRIVQARESCARCGADAFCVHRLPPETVIRALEDRLVWRDSTER
jgi:Glycosyltransferase family 9 (heptosyltransferase)